MDFDVIFTIRTIADVTTAVVKVVMDIISCSIHNSIENKPRWIIELMLVECINYASAKVTLTLQLSYINICEIFLYMAPIQNYITQHTVGDSRSKHTNTLLHVWNNSSTLLFQVMIILYYNHHHHIIFSNNLFIIIIITSL